MTGKGGQTMLKAIIRKGAIVPAEPLPNYWIEGTEVTVEAIDGPK
jgi:hypothetical protein